VPYNDPAALREKVLAIQEARKAGSKQGLAAILMEPLQGEGGIRPGQLEFFRAVRDLCDETGALMMVDEVQTGMGRTGKMWAYEHFGANCQPDVFSSAKALGGGVPIGAMCCTEKCNVFGPGDHASTYGGNPLACAAGLAVASAFDNDGLLQNVQERSMQFRQLADKLQAKYPALISEVRGWGLINGVEIAESSGITAAMITKALMDNGLLVVPAGLQVVRFVPPLVVSEADVATAMRKLDEALALLSA
jgi:acetylornithine/N-succinyldiaminopimelate aminotransferase